MTDYTTRIAHRNYAAWDILCDYTSRPNDSVIANRDAFKDLHIASKPHPSSNVNRFAMTGALTALLCIKGVIYGINPNVWTEQRIRPDADFCTVQNHTPKIDIDIVFDRNVLPKFTTKIRFNPHVTSHMLKQLLH